MRRRYKFDAQSLVRREYTNLSVVLWRSTDRNLTTTAKSRRWCPLGFFKTAHRVPVLCLPWHVALGTSLCLRVFLSQAPRRYPTACSAGSATPTQHRSALYITPKIPVEHSFERAGTFPNPSYKQQIDTATTRLHTFESLHSHLSCTLI